MPNEPRDEAQSPLYQGGAHAIDNYTLDPGVCILPLAEDPPTSLGELQVYSPVVVARLHAPYRIRRARNESMKQNNPPVVPAPEDTGKFVFVGGSINFDKRLNTTLRSFDWEVISDYVFVENCVSRNQDGFVLGAVPWTWRTTWDKYLEGYGLTGVVNNDVGAVARAGIEARIGFVQGEVIGNYLTNGTSIFTYWSYTNDAFFPGTMLSSDLPNGGPPTPFSLI